jgi:hypothetical protein
MRTVATWRAWTPGPAGTGPTRGNWCATCLWPPFWQSLQSAEVRIPTLDPTSCSGWNTAVLLRLGTQGTLIPRYRHPPCRVILLTCSGFILLHYYKKRFVVSADNQFLVPARASDTICVIQKIKHLWCRSVLIDTKNLNFSVSCFCQLAPKIKFQK